MRNEFCSCWFGVCLLLSYVFFCYRWLNIQQNPCRWDQHADVHRFCQQAPLPKMCFDKEQWVGFWIQTYIVLFVWMFISDIFIPRCLIKTVRFRSQHRELQVQVQTLSCHLLTTVQKKSHLADNKKVSCLSLWKQSACFCIQQMYITWKMFSSF